MSHLKTQEKSPLLPFLKNKQYAVLIHLFGAVCATHPRATNQPDHSLLPSLQAVPSRSHHLERRGNLHFIFPPRMAGALPGKQAAFGTAGIGFKQQSGHMEFKLKCFKKFSISVSVSVKEGEYRKRKMVMRNNLKTV